MEVILTGHTLNQVLLLNVDEAHFAGHTIEATPEELVLTSLKHEMPLLLITIAMVH